jgi:thiol-disulfide isomerase/thioredoxin
MRKVLITLALLWSVGACKGGNMFPAKAVTHAPELPVYGAERWINSPPLTMKELRGKIVVVDFWEYTCVNCIRTLPYVTAWSRRYADYGVVIVGVHTPEFEFGKDRANVERAVEDFGIEYPVVLDNDYEIWRAYANSYWPRKYVVGRDGKIIYDHVGEGGYAETEELLQRLVREEHPDAELPPVLAPVRPEDGPGARCYPRTPELYCGYERGRYGGGALGEDEARAYVDDGPHAEGRLYLSGTWRVGVEQAIFVGDGGAEAFMLVPFSANEVNAVMSAPRGETVRVYVKRDGRPLGKDEAGEEVAFDAAGDSYVAVSVGKMYRLLAAAEYGDGELSLHPKGPGVSIFAFTFGSCAME